MVRHYIFFAGADADALYLDKALHSYPIALNVLTAVID